METIRTTTHEYPREELNAMFEFYGGKRCVIQRSQSAVEFAHVLDAALESSNLQVESIFLISFSVADQMCLLAFCNAGKKTP